MWRRIPATSRRVSSSPSPAAHWGKRTTTFWSKLHARKHARTECFPKSGTVYHLFSRRLYRQIERENIRNRREHEIEYIQRRIGMLDFVLLNEGYQYLETEPEKVRFFCGTLNIQKHYLPARLYLGSKTSSTSVRHFVDKFPMFFVPPSPVVTFTYIHEGAAAFTDFVRHLESYLPLFRQLSEFRLVYVSRTDSHFGKATEIFSSLVKIPLESDIASDLLHYFRVRKAWDEKQYGRSRMPTSFFGTMRVPGLPGKDSKGCIADGKTVASAKSASGRRLERMTGSTALASIRFCCNGLGLSWIQRIPSEEGKNYALHFLKLTLLHPEKIRSPWKPEKYETGESESHRGKNVKSGGSDPTFSAFSRPKSSWGRSRPAAR